jgi:DNA-binding Lrp family transcriptional regulator
VTIDEVKKMGNNVMAYVLMEIEIGMTDQVLDELRRIDQATRVSVTTGAYDIVVLLEVGSLEQLYDITVHQIHAIQGIKETTTAVIEKMETV